MNTKEYIIHKPYGDSINTFKESAKMNSRCWCRFPFSLRLARELLSPHPKCTWSLHCLSLVNSCSYVLISPYILICISPLPNEAKHLSDSDLPSEDPLGGNSFSTSRDNELFTYCWGFRVGSHTGHGPLVVKVVWV